MAEIGISVNRAKRLLLKGEVIGLPTETVYGLAGNALNEEVILKIFEVKDRPKFDPLIAHTNSLEKAEKLVKVIPPKAKLLASRFWPGPLTLLLDKLPIVPDLLTSGHSKVAVRVPGHAIALELLSQLDFPLAAPSANPFGYVSPTSARHVEDQLGDKIPFVLDGGASEVGLESTIVGFEHDEVVVYRLGGISLEDLESVIGSVVTRINNSSDPSAPGMLKSHYSPGRKITVGNIGQKIIAKNKSEIGVISFKSDFQLPEKNHFILSPSGDLNEAARNIFTALRKMDQPFIKEVFAEWVPDEGLGRAINDRLRRASA